MHNQGIGNEIGFYIFAYDAHFEPLVEGYLPRLKEQLAARQLTVLEFNLYQNVTVLIDG